jgi:hypothetical protein
VFCTKLLCLVAFAGLAIATVVGLVVGTPTTEEGGNRSIAVADSHKSAAAGYFNPSSPYVPGEPMYLSNGGWGSPISGNPGSGGCHGSSTPLIGSFLAGSSCYGRVASPGMAATESSGGCFGRNGGSSNSVASQGGGCYGRQGGGY